MAYTIFGQKTSGKGAPADPTLVGGADWDATRILAGGAKGDVLVYDSTQTSRLNGVADVATGSVFVSGGIGSLPSWSANPTVTTVTASTALIVGTTPATSGEIRLPNGGQVTFRNAANAANYNLLGTSGGTNILILGDPSAPLIGIAGATSSFPAIQRTSASLAIRLADNSDYTGLRASLFQMENGSVVQDSSNGVGGFYASNASTLGTWLVGVLSVGTTPATTGAGRFASGALLAWRNSGNTDQAAFGLNGSNIWSFDAGGVYGSGFTAGTSSTSGFDLTSGAFTLRSATSMYVWTTQTGKPLIVGSNGGDNVYLIGRNNGGTDESSITFRNFANNASFGAINAASGGLSIITPGLCIGGATDPDTQFLLRGTLTGTGGSVNVAAYIFTTLAPNANIDARALYVNPTFTEAGSGTHGLFASQFISIATVNAGAAAVTNTASLYIAGPMTATVTGLNYVMWLAAGTTVRWGGYGAGAATFDANGNISSVSDVRFKEQVRDYCHGLAAVRQLRPVLYRWNELSKLDRENDYVGFIAQEVESVLGETSIGRDENGYLTLQERAIVAATVKAVQELATRIEMAGL